MRYLTLAADYTGSAVRDDYLGLVVPEEVGLSHELGSAIRAWNDRYRAIIPLSVASRSEPTVRSTIRELDQEGLQLAGRILEELPGSKVRYYSEGDLGYLSVSGAGSLLPAGASGADYRPIVQRRVGKYRRLSRVHLAAIGDWLKSNPMPYQIAGGSALGQFSDRMYGRALSDNDRGALSIALAANSLLLEWPHDERSGDWQLLVFPAWVCSVLGFEWRPVVHDVLIDLAERSKARDADPALMRRRFADIASLVDDHLGASLVPVGPSGRLTVPVWVNGEVELARVWNDRVDRDGYFERVARQSSAGGSTTQRSDFEDLDRMPWIENAGLSEQDLWETVEEIDDDVRRALDGVHRAGNHAAVLALDGNTVSAYVRDRAFAVGVGADDSVLADLLYVASLRAPELLTIGLRAAQCWSDGESTDRIRSVAAALPLEAGDRVLDWLDHTRPTLSTSGGLVETSALMWLTFSPRWRPEASWWAAVDNSAAA